MMTTPITRVIDVGVLEEEPPDRAAEDVDGHEHDGEPGDEQQHAAQQPAARRRAASTAVAVGAASADARRVGVAEPDEPRSADRRSAAARPRRR